MKIAPQEHILHEQFYLIATFHDNTIKARLIRNRLDKIKMFG
jgi:hypothetical protein